MLAEASPVPLKVDGVTVHTGLETVPATEGVTVQPSVMVPLNPEAATT
jgi:hypothetical protein